MLYLVLYECFKRGPLCHNQVARDRCATNQATKRFRAALRFANRFGHLLVGSVSPADRYNRERRTAIKWKLIRCGAARPPFRVKPGHACCLLGCSVGIDQARVVCFFPSAVHGSPLDGFAMSGDVETQHNYHMPQKPWIPAPYRWVLLFIA